MKRDKSRPERQSRRIREGDTVVVIAGDDRGKTGKVLSRADASRFVVQGIRICTKAVRRSEAYPEGGFIKIERPIQSSNLMLCGEEGKGFRVKVRTNSDGVKERYGIINGQATVHGVVGKAR